MKIVGLTQEAWRALKVLAGLSLLLGLAYPLALTLLARAWFPSQAAGSLIIADGRVEGSELIGQSFKDPQYFWSRPSATSPYPYNATASGASNLGPQNPALFDAVKARLAALRGANPGETGPVPADLATASASGLDPDISPDAAYYQAARVAKARGLSRSRVDALIRAHLQGPLWGFWGQSRVNALELNLALNALAAPSR